ncbi:MAG: hypothetical protein NC336_06510 [Clostridium sp.]|nr:hypothetical protein [Clostridium sp.]
MKRNQLFLLLALFLIAIPAFIFTACSDDDDFSNKIKVDAVIASNDSVRYKIPDNSFLGIETEITFDLNEPRACTIDISFNCIDQVNWQTTSLPSFITSPQTSGSGEGHLILNVAANTSGQSRSGRFSMRLFQADPNSGNTVELIHDIVVNQPK